MAVFTETRETFSQFQARQKAKVAARRMGKESLARRLQQTRDPKQVKALTQQLQVRVQQPTLFTSSGVKARPKTVNGQRFVEGFTRADLVRQRAIQEKQRLLALADQAQRDAERQQNLLGQTTARLRAEKEAEELEELLRTQQPIPTRLRLIQEERRQEIIKSIPREKKLNFLQSINKKVSEKLGLKKIQKRIESRRLEDIKKQGVILQNKINNLENKPKLNIIQKRQLKNLRKELKNIQGKQVVDLIVDDVLKNPVSNAGIILISAGASKGVQAGRLSLANLATKSPVLAKRIGVSGKVASGLLGAAYITTVGNQAFKEFQQTGNTKKTQADTIRELLLFATGAKIGVSKRTEAIIGLKNEINKLPKSQRIILNKQLEKIKKLSNKEFGTKDIGIVSNLEKQQIIRTLKSGKLKENLITITKDRIFVVKKGQIPKVSKGFDVESIAIKGVKQNKGVTVSRGLRSTLRAKFNPRTSRLEILKLKNAEVVEPSKIRGLFTKFNIKNKDFVKKKVIPVKASRRLIKTKKEGSILEIDLTKAQKPFLRFIPKPILKTINVKNFNRVLKKVFTQRVKVTNKKIKGVKDDVFSIQEFTPTKLKVRVKNKKGIKKNVDLKINDVLLVDNQGRFIRVKKVPKTVTSTVNKKPIIEVRTIKEGKQVLIPFKKGVNITSPEIKKPGIKKKIVKPRPRPPRPISKTKRVSKIRRIQKPKKKPISKPIQKPSKKPVQKPKKKPVVDVRRKKKQDIIRKAKIKALQAQRLKKQKLRLKRQKILRQIKANFFRKLRNKRTNVRRVIDRIRFSIPSKFQPSLLAIINEVKALEEPEKITGLELRPIIIKLAKKKGWKGKKPRRTKK